MAARRRRALPGPGRRRAARDAKRVRLPALVRRAACSSSTVTPATASYAIDETEKFVAAEEEKIARNQRAAVAGDSYLEVGQIIGNVALVYDWCHEQLTPQQRERWIAYANQAVWNVWNPTPGTLGQHHLCVDRLVGRQPVEQLLLLVPARDHAARPGDRRRERRRRRQWLAALPRSEDRATSCCRPSHRDLTGRRLARGHGLRHGDEEPVPALRLVAALDRRTASPRARRTRWRRWRT